MEFEDLPIYQIIYTDIDKDGMMNGPNFEETKKLADVSKFPIIASGGISKIEDLEKLSLYENIHGAICGKALYENSLNLKEILKDSINNGSYSKNYSVFRRQRWKGG